MSKKNDLTKIASEVEDLAVISAQPSSSQDGTEKNVPSGQADFANQHQAEPLDLMKHAGYAVEDAAITSTQLSSSGAGIEENVCRLANFANQIFEGNLKIIKRAANLIDDLEIACEQPSSSKDEGKKAMPVRCLIDFTKLLLDENLNAIKRSTDVIDGLEIACEQPCLSKDEGKKAMPVRCLIDFTKLLLDENLNAIKRAANLIDDHEIACEQPCSSKDEGEKAMPLRCLIDFTKLLLDENLNAMKRAANLIDDLKVACEQPCSSKDEGEKAMHVRCLADFTKQLLDENLNAMKQRPRVLANSPHKTTKSTAARRRKKQSSFLKESQARSGAAESSALQPCSLHPKKPRQKLTKQRLQKQKIMLSAHPSSASSAPLHDEDHVGPLAPFVTTHDDPSMLQPCHVPRAFRAPRDFLSHPAPRPQYPGSRPHASMLASPSPARSVQDVVNLHNLAMREQSTVSPFHQQTRPRISALPAQPSNDRRSQASANNFHSRFPPPRCRLPPPYQAPQSNNDEGMPSNADAAGTSQYHQIICLKEMTDGQVTIEYAFPRVQMNISTLPHPMRSANLAVMKGCIYVIGDYTSKTIFCLDTKKRQLMWERAGTLNSERIHHGTTIYEDFIMIVGGQESDGETYHTSFECFYPETRECVVKKANETVCPRARFSMTTAYVAAVKANAAFCVGGTACKERTLTSIAIYSKKKDEEGIWDFVTELPSPRHSAAVASVANSLYIIGGKDYSNTPCHYDLILDLVTLRWDLMTNSSFRPESWDGSVCVADGDIYSFGGKFIDHTGTTQSCTVSYRYSTSEKLWYYLEIENAGKVVGAALLQ